VSYVYEIWIFTKFKISSIEERLQGVKELPDLSAVAQTHSNKLYIGCPRKNVPDFGRVFFILKYTDITQNTYVQS